MTFSDVMITCVMKNSKLIDGLIKLYGVFDEKCPNHDWVERNSLILNYAKNAELVLGGSIAMAITRKKAAKIPGDFDFFTNSNQSAMNFITSIMNYLHGKKGSYYRIYVNNETKFTLEGVKSHYRIVGPPYWLPICVMVLEKPIRKFYWNSLPVQFFDDVVNAAKKTTEKDGKERVDVQKIDYDNFDNESFLPKRSNFDLDFDFELCKECDISTQISNS